MARAWTSFPLLCGISPGRGPAETPGVGLTRRRESMSHNRFSGTARRSSFVARRVRRTFPRILTRTRKTEDAGTIRRARPVSDDRTGGPIRGGPSGELALVPPFRVIPRRSSCGGRRRFRAGEGNTPRPFRVPLASERVRSGRVEVPPQARTFSTVRLDSYHPSPSGLRDPVLLTHELPHVFVAGQASSTGTKSGTTYAVTSRGARVWVTTKGGWGHDEPRGCTTRRASWALGLDRAGERGRRRLQRPNRAQVHRIRQARASAGRG